MNELDENILTLEYLLEDEAAQTQVVLEALLALIAATRSLSYEAALEASRVFAKQTDWERSKHAALANHEEESL